MRLDTLEEIATLEAPEPRCILMMRLSADGRYLAAAASNTIHLWDLHRVKVLPAALKPTEIKEPVWALKLIRSRPSSTFQSLTTPSICRPRPTSCRHSKKTGSARHGNRQHQVIVVSLTPRLKGLVRAGGNLDPEVFQFPDQHGRQRQLPCNL
jgi:hypothetical protein